MNKLSDKHGEATKAIETSKTINNYAKIGAVEKSCAKKTCVNRARKGQFFSLTVFLFIALLLVLFSFIAGLKEKDESFHVERLKKGVVNHFVTDFEEIYIPQIVGAAAKPALNGWLSRSSASIEMEDLSDIMLDGRLGESPIEYFNPEISVEESLGRALSTLNLPLDNRQDPDFFTLELVSVDQESFDRITLDFVASYKFRSDTNEWSMDEIPVTVAFDIYYLPHPGYSGEIIDEFWEHDSSGVCFISEVFDDAEACNGFNLRPPDAT